MKYIHNALRSLLVFLSFFVQVPAQAQERSFVVVIPSYNNKEWYKRNLESVLQQSYDNYRIIYVDDASPDKTGAYVQEYIEKNGLEGRITLIRNEKRIGALANIHKAVWMCSPEEIVVNLDGDDWLAHHEVLAHLSDVYADRDVWLTYGQFIYYPSYSDGIGCEIPKEVIEKNEFRSFTRGTTALRTFYAGLFQQIKKEDLFFEGDFFHVGYDLAMMFPMLEMAGRHIRYVPEVAYVYNINTPINDFKINNDEQAETDHYLRAGKKYQPIIHYKQKGSNKIVYMTPGLWGELFAISNPMINRDNCLEVLYNLRNTAAEAGYNLLQADNLDNLEDFEYLIVFDIFLDQLSSLAKYPKEKLILFLWEPPSVLPQNYHLENHKIFSKVYTWNDSLIDNKKYFKFFYPVMNPMIEPIDFYFKRLCAMVACNKESLFPGELYSERRNVIDFFENYCCNDFDLYGKGWSYYYKNYQGPIEKKIDYLKYYKFCFAYENVSQISGYVTEKIFDCFRAGTVPIYWGAPNVTDYIPKGCFIAREDFTDMQALYDFIKNMNEYEYLEYIRNIKKFLEGPEAKKFSQQHFIKLVMNLITTPTKVEK